MADSITLFPSSGDELRIYSDSRDAVSLEQIGQFLLAFGEEMQKSVGSGYVLELADVEYSSLDQLFRRRPKQRIKAIGKVGRLSQKQKNQIARGSLHVQKKSNLLQAATLAMTTIGVAAAANGVLKDSDGTQAFVEQNNKPCRIIQIDEIKYEVEREERDRQERRDAPKRKKQVRLMEHLQAGETFSFGGYVLRRK